MPAAIPPLLRALPACRINPPSSKAMSSSNRSNSSAASCSTTRLRSPSIDMPTSPNGLGLSDHISNCRASALRNLGRKRVEQRLAIRRLARKMRMAPIDLDPRLPAVGPDIADRPRPAHVVECSGLDDQQVPRAQRLVPDLGAAIDA